MPKGQKIVVVRDREDKFVGDGWVKTYCIPTGIPWEIECHHTLSYMRWGSIGRRVKEGNKVMKLKHHEKPSLEQFVPGEFK